MYIKAEAGSNDIKVAYFSKIDFEGNLFNENRAHLLSIYPLQSQKQYEMIKTWTKIKIIIIRNHKATVIRSRDGTGRDLLDPTRPIKFKI